jgi:transposase
MMDGYPSNLQISEPNFCRSEVLDGPERRRRWSVEEKARIVGESLAPDAVVSVVARRHGIHPNQLYGWRREFRSVPTNGASPGDFVPISVVASSSGATGAPSEPDGRIEIVIGVATVRIPTLVHEMTLQRVLAVVTRLR